MYNFYGFAIASTVPKIAKKPDWTGLSNTTHNQVCQKSAMSSLA